MSEKPETVQEYRSALLIIAGQSKILGMLPIPGMLEMIERADSFGAVLDPTLYRDKREAMMEDKEILEAALPLYRLGVKLQAAVDAAVEAYVTKEKEGG